MPPQRKIFRIEESALVDVREPPPSFTAPGEDAELRHRKLMSEVVTLRALLNSGAQTADNGRDRALAGKASELKRELRVIFDAVGRTQKELGTPRGDALGLEITRLRRELGTVVATTEQATHTILSAAEDIERIVTSLAPLLKGEYAHGLTQDLHDHVMRIFEASNFQDLTGQRIKKVETAFEGIERHLFRLQEIWSEIEDRGAPSAANLDVRPADERALLNGPMLAGDPGHSTQSDIDKLFD
jgi:chemotaxis protein CheZ